MPSAIARTALACLLALSPGLLLSPPAGAAEPFAETLVSVPPRVRPALPEDARWFNTRVAPTEACLAGRPVVVLVWNAQAVPARRTLPWFARLSRHYHRPGHDTDAVFLTVHVPESAEPADTATGPIARALAEVPKNRLAGVPVLLDSDARYHEALGSPALPTVLVFGRDGALVSETVGRVGRFDNAGRQIGRDLRRALAAPRA